MSWKELLTQFREIKPIEPEIWYFDTNNTKRDPMQTIYRTVDAILEKLANEEKI